MKLRDPELNRQLEKAVADYDSWPQWMKAEPAMREAQLPESADREAPPSLGNPKE